MQENEIYRPPANPESYPKSNLEDPAVLGELVRGWEKMRLRYNLILLPFGIITMLIWSEGVFLNALALTIPSALFAVAANVCYLAGPTGEMYLRVFFLQSKPAPKLRQTLYWLGVVFSLGIILVTLVFGIFLSQMNLL